MINSKYIIFLIFLVSSHTNNACDAPASYYQLGELQKNQNKVFIGKAIEQVVVKDFMGEIEKIKIRFKPVNITKGEVSLNDYFWFPTTKNSLSVVIGETYFIYADEVNEIYFGDFCFNSGSHSLGIVTPEQVDATLVKRRLQTALMSDSRNELTWAKKHLKMLIKNTADKNIKEKWLKQLSHVVVV